MSTIQRFAMTPSGPIKIGSQGTAGARKTIRRQVQVEIASAMPARSSLLVRGTVRAGGMYGEGCHVE
jgi:hypothetical protein